MWAGNESFQRKDQNNAVNKRGATKEMTQCRNNKRMRQLCWYQWHLTILWLWIHHIKLLLSSEHMSHMWRDARNTTKCAYYSFGPEQFLITSTYTLLDCFSQSMASSGVYIYFNTLKNWAKLESDVHLPDPDGHQYLFTNLNYTRIFYSYTHVTNFISCPPLFRLGYLKIKQYVLTIVINYEMTKY